MTNIEIQNYYQKESRFHRAYSRDNFPDKVEDGAHATYLDEYADVDTPWIALHVSNNDAIYFETTGVEHVAC